MKIHPVKSWVDPCRWMGGWTDKMMLAVTFRNFVNVPQNYKNKQKGGTDRK